MSIHWQNCGVKELFSAKNKSRSLAVVTVFKDLGISKLLPHLSINIFCIVGIFVRICEKTYLACNRRISCPCNHLQSPRARSSSCRWRIPLLHLCISSFPCISWRNKHIFYLCNPRQSHAAWSHISSCKSLWIYHIYLYFSWHIHLARKRPCMLYIVTVSILITTACRLDYIENITLIRCIIFVILTFFTANTRFRFLAKYLYHTFWVAIFIAFPTTFSAFLLPVLAFLPLWLNLVIVLDSLRLDLCFWN